MTSNKNLRFSERDSPSPVEMNQKVALIHKWQWCIIYYKHLLTLGLKLVVPGLGCAPPSLLSFWVRLSKEMLGKWDWSEFFFDWFILVVLSWYLVHRHQYLLQQTCLRVPLTIRKMRARQYGGVITNCVFKCISSREKIQNAVGKFGKRKNKNNSQILLVTSIYFFAEALREYLNFLLGGLRRDELELNVPWNGGSGGIDDDEPLPLFSRHRPPNWPASRLFRPRDPEPPIYYRQQPADPFYGASQDIEEVSHILVI